MFTEQQVGIAAKLYEARTTLRRLLGDAYDAKVEPYRAEVRRCVEKTRLPPLQAFLWLQRQLEKRGGWVDGMASLYWFAAVADVAEGHGGAE